jgi:hypothetical protein
MTQHLKGNNMKQEPNGIAVNMGTSTFSVGTSHTSTHGLYSAPQLMDVIVNKDTIELIYQKQYMVSYNYGMPSPEVYKEIYSRTDGSMVVEKGRYIPAQPESYEFD